MATLHNTRRWCGPYLTAVLVVLATASPAGATRPLGAYSTDGTWRFVSAPSVHAPRLAVLERRRGLAPGRFLVTNMPNVADPRLMTGEGGPEILDNRLRPVWVHGVGSDVGSTNLEQQSYRGQPVLVFWQGGLTAFGGTTNHTQVAVLDRHYRPIASLEAAAPWVIDPHDAAIQGDNLWVTVHRTVARQDLAPYGGAQSGSVVDMGVQEYSLSTKKLLYTWDALNPGGRPHVPLADSEQPPPSPLQTKSSWDAYHLNSLQTFPDGRVLLSMRNTWAVYLIDPAIGTAIWTLGGRASDFKLPPDAHFAWQHDARLLLRGDRPDARASEELTLFNDNCCLDGNLATALGSSEAMILRLNARTHRVRSVARYRHAPDIQTPYLGSAQVLPNGNVLVGWGIYFSEYSRSGRQLLDVEWPGKDRSYRILYTNNWVGTPYYPPRGAVRRVRGLITVYASWNGATQVVGWQVLAGPSAGALKLVAVHRRTGFETAIALTRSYRVYELRALGGRGAVLRASRPFSR